MGRVNLPNPTERAVICKFLTESSGMWVEGVEYERLSSGLKMKATYRTFADETKTQTLQMDDCKEFEELTLLMSDVLDNISGVALALMERKKARQAMAHA